MSVVRDFRNLIAWQKGHRLVLSLHAAMEELRPGSSPGLRAQLLRAATSISANIAEGCGKRTDAEFARYIDIALGSSRELENHLVLLRDLNRLDARVADRLLIDLDEVRRILFSLGRAVRRRAQIEG